MALGNATPLRVSGSRHQPVHPTGDFRLSALIRLYERRSAVDNLIRALERYQEEQKGLPAKRPPL